MRHRLPEWFRQKLGDSTEKRRTEGVLAALNLCTVCEEAVCPNRGECFGAGTATFMILGRECTRNCRYCNVSHGNPLSPDPDEPERLAEAVLRLGLKYVVVTSVTRDDLSDGGAGHFAKVLSRLRTLCEELRIEILTPDFMGKEDAFESVGESKPEVWGHNVEVVPRLFPDLRPGASYHGSLSLLKSVKERWPEIKTKSALMIGLGETEEEILSACKDLLSVGTDFVVLGQYLAPSGAHHPVERFYTPEEFKSLGKKISELGFGKGVLSEPLARSSYKAEELFLEKGE